MPIKKADLDAEYDLDVQTEVEKIAPKIDMILRTRYKPGLKAFIGEKDLEYLLDFSSRRVLDCLRDLYPDWKIELVSEAGHLLLVFS